MIVRISHFHMLCMNLFVLSILLMNGRCLSMPVIFSSPFSSISHRLSVTIVKYDVICP